MVQMNDDCLLEVFAQLASSSQVNLPSTTFCSCIYVNKAWCRAALPYVWRQPMILGVSQRRRLSLSRIYIRCLAASGKCPTQFLPRINSKKNERPLFDYSSFVQQVNLFDLLLLACEWLYYQRTVRGEAKSQLKVAWKKLVHRASQLGRQKMNERIADFAKTHMKEAIVLCNAWVELFRNLKHLDVDYARTLVDNSVFCQPSQLAIDLSKCICLNVLSWRQDGIKADLIRSLARGCNTLTNIAMALGPLRQNTEEFDDAFAELVRTQRSLREISIQGTSSFAWSRSIEALSLHADSLRCVGFHNFTFHDAAPFALLARCTALFELRLLDCRYCDQGIFAPLADARLETVRYLHVRQSPSDAVQPASIVSAFPMLTKLNVSESTALFRLLAAHCPDVTELATQVSFANADDFENLLACVHDNLTHLTLNCNINDDNGQWLFELVCRHPMPNLVDFGYQGYNSCLPATLLRSFWSDPKPKLRDVKIAAKGLEDDHLRVVLENAGTALKKVNMVLREVSDDTMNRAKETIPDLGIISE